MRVSKEGSGGGGRIGRGSLEVRRLGVHPQVLGDVRDRPAGLQRQPHTALDQLIWVLPGSWHPRRVS